MLAGAAGAGLGIAGRSALADVLADPTLDRMAREVPDYFRPGVPRGLQLSFDADPATTRTVTWFTSDDPTSSVVQWGEIGADTDASEVTTDLLTHTAVGSVEAAPFGDGDIEDFLAPIRSGGVPHPGERRVHVHRARMTGLAPGRRIAYRVGDGTTWSTVRTTTGGPDLDRGFRFTHVGDHGPSLAAQRTTRALAARNPDWHLFAGDLSYANGDQRIWDLWAEQYSVMGAGVPTMSSPGNHESKDYMGETYRRRFSYPNHGSSFYAFTYGNVFVVSTAAGAFFGDVEAALEDIRHELLWMEHTLARAALLRALGEIDFIVVTQHFPSYTDHRTRGPISPDRVVAAEQILQRYQVDLLLVGHDHMYQRSYPMAYGLPTHPEAYRSLVSGLLGGAAPDRPERYSNATGYIEVIAGSGGNGMYEFTEIDTFDLAVDPDNPIQRHLPWLASSARENCFVEYDVEGGEMTVTGFVFPDGYDEGVGNGVAGDEVRYDANDTRFADDLEPVAFDSFTLVRKDFAADVPTVARAAAEVLGDIPEAFGVLAYDHDDDCTAH